MSVQFTKVRNSPSDSVSVMRYGVALGTPPTISSLNYSVGDTLGGGQDIIITGTGIDAGTTASIGGVPLVRTGWGPTFFSGTLGARAAGVVNVVLTNSYGSATLVGGFEYWDPSVETTCNLFAEKPNYDGGTGTWSRRVGASDITKLLGTNPTSSAGAPTFNATGCLSTNTLVDTLLPFAGGTVMCVVNPSSEDNPEASAATPYANKAIWSKQGSGPFELWNATDGVNHWFGTSAYDSTLGSYIIARRNSTNLPGSPHAVVSTYKQANWIRISVDGSSLASSSTPLSGTATSITGFPLILGADYSLTNGFSGTMLAFVTMNADATDTIATKFYQWSRQRLGVT